MLKPSIKGGEAWFLPLICVITPLRSCLHHSPRIPALPWRRNGDTDRRNDRKGRSRLLQQSHSKSSASFFPLTPGEKPETSTTIRGVWCPGWGNLSTTLWALSDLVSTRINLFCRKTHAGWAHTQTGLLVTGRRPPAKRKPARTKGRSFGRVSVSGAPIRATVAD